MNRKLKAMDILDCYKILGVKQNSNWERVKRSYHKLARIYHPDLNFGDPFLESRFKKITQAYNILDRYNVLLKTYCPYPSRILHP